jgi:hypothetical protein
MQVDGRRRRHTGSRLLETVFYSTGNLEIMAFAVKSCSEYTLQKRYETKELSKKLEMQFYGKSLDVE